MVTSLAQSAFDLVYSVLALSVALGAALFVIMAAWYLVWKLVLSKVPFFREILGLNPNPSRPPQATGKAAAAQSRRRSPTYDAEGSLPRKPFITSSTHGKHHSMLTSQASSWDGEGLRRTLSSSLSELPASTRSSSETPVPESDASAEPTTAIEDPKGKSRVRFGADELVFEDDYIR